MDLDKEFLKQLIATFKVELEEQLQAITNGLLQLEKHPDDEQKNAKVLEVIFRSAHNIKGSARGIGVNDVGEIAHEIESLFSTLKEKNVAPKPELINLCLEAIDSMRKAMESFLEEKPLSFNIKNLLIRLKAKQSNQEILQKTTKENQTVTPTQSQKPNIESKDQLLTEAYTVNKELESIRVSLTKLERVSTLIEELQANKIAFNDQFSELMQLTSSIRQFNTLLKQTLSAFKKNIGPHMEENLQRLYILNIDAITEIYNNVTKLYKSSHRTNDELALISHSLQTEARLLRLVPLSTAFCTFPRLIRDIAQELNKQVELEIRNEGIEMDQMVLAALHDPFVHILRNALDHGIESPEIRKSLGKTPVGHITITVTNDGSQINIDFTDDGAGIDITKIGETAVKKKLISHADINELSEKEILDLIFLPGFSTKEIITDVSGRGVGLDVVKTNINSLKGFTAVTTELGKSTTITLRVPLTLAVDRGLLVRSGGQIFAIPTFSIQRVLMLKPEEIIEVEANQAILLDHRPIPLWNLADIIELEPQKPITQHQIPIIVLKRGWQIAAFLVEEIIAEKEITIKTLQPPLTTINNISGGTLSGSGEIIVILNPRDLINTAFHKGKSTTLISKNEITLSKSKPHILVVDDSITTRTLEKNILENKGYRVSVAIDGKDAWNILQKQKFSLIITDVAMPNIDGFTLTERIRQSKELHDLPVVIVTGLGSETEKKRGIAVGADAYIVKNEFESEMLLEIVSQLIM